MSTSMVGSSLDHAITTLQPNAGFPKDTFEVEKTKIKREKPSEPLFAHPQRNTMRPGPISTRERLDAECQHQHVACAEITTSLAIAQPRRTCNDGNSIEALRTSC